MESLRLLTISDLIRRSRPFTATSSLHASVSPPPASNPTPKTSHKPSNPTPRTLTPLTFPAILAGTLTLPAHEGPSSPKPSPPSPCPTNNCLQFSDGSATICCDVLHLDVRLIGRKFHVLAWNFIPLARGCGGFLEIIKWGFPDSACGHNRNSNVDSFRLDLGSSTCGNGSKAKYRVHGALECISPVSVVPCTIGTSTSQSSTAPQGDAGATSLRGFIMQIMVCDCKFCCSKGAVLGPNESTPGQDSHFYSKPGFVYFCGFASSWHPVLTKLIGKVVTLSGLKKKLLFIGKEESQLMFVTTETTVLYLPRPPKKWLPCTNSILKGNGECGVYTGVVKGVYLQALVVELDKDVWLLLTDQLITPPHSLRIGAVVTVRNVHFVNPKFHWKRLLILGACFKTSITIESFSPLETGCHLVSQSVSLLGKFIESLTFSARLWVLLLVSCFRKKFTGFLSEKVILGSKHKEGLVQMYASSHLPPSVFQSRHGVFSELSKHDSCGCGIEPYDGDFKFVSPISSFINHCEIRWITHLQPEDNHQLSYNSTKYIPSYDAKSCRRSIRKIFPSEDTSPILLGSLKVSPSSGRLQLVDRTGCIDVIVPDLPSTWDNNSIYEITDYTLVIEGMPELTDHLELLEKESSSLRDVFGSAPLARETKLEMYIYFSMRSSTCRIYPNIVWMDSIAEVECGKFHLLYIAHKFPLPQKGNSVKSKKLSMFTEAIVLPWDLVLAGKDGLSYSNEETRYRLREPKGHRACTNCQRNVSSKRHKSNITSSGSFASNQMDDSRSASCEIKTCSGLSTEPKEEWGCHDSSHDIPCLATVRRGNNQSETVSGLLYCMKADKNFVGEKPSPRKVLLELDSDNFVRYQLLQIGGYYITKHNKDDSFCNLKDLDYAIGAKVLATTSTFMWSISFSSDDSSININEVPFGDQMELHLQRYKGYSAGTCSDVCLHFPAEVLGVLEANLKGCAESVAKSDVSQQKIANGSLSYPQSSGLFPEGNLISLSGDVIDVYYLDYSLTDVGLSHRSLADSDKLRSHQTITSHICVHVMVDHDIVKIFGSLSKHACPIGFGPGVNATFHRLLESGGQNSMMLTPVSFLVINSIRAVSYPPDHKDYSLCAASDKYDVASRDHSSALISELVQFSECSPVRFHCRVVSVHILIMKKYPKSKIHSKSLPIDIPVACFMLDDGSSSCYCWASAERAATFLRLHEEFPEGASESSSWTLKCLGRDKNTMYHLERILNKYDGVTLKNYGFLLDSSCQDLTVSVNTDNPFSSSDETLLKLMVVTACSGAYLTVVGGVMDLDAVGRLERLHCFEMETTVQSLKHIWAAEVYHTNPLTEARDVIRELQNRY